MQVATYVFHKDGGEPIPQACFGSFGQVRGSASGQAEVSAAAAVKPCARERSKRASFRAMPVEVCYGCRRRRLCDPWTVGEPVQGFLMDGQVVFSMCLPSHRVRTAGRPAGRSQGTVTTTAEGEMLVRHLQSYRGLQAK